MANIPLNVEISPLVVLSILDHHARRNDAGERVAQDRVIGVVLGSVVGRTVEIRNAMPVSHAEDRAAGELRIDVDFQKTLYDLNLKVCMRDVMVGWYATCFTDTTALLHDFYLKEKMASHVHLLIDPSSAGSPEGIAIRCLVTAPPLPDADPVFREIPVTIKCHPFEDTALHSIAQSLDKSLTHRARGAPSSILQHAAKFQTTPSQANEREELAHLTRELDWLLRFVDEVHTDNAAPDDEAGRAIDGMISLIAPAPSDQFEKSLSDGIQDVLAVSYLAKLTRAQLIIAERSHRDLSQQQQRGPKGGPGGYRGDR